MDPAFNSPSLFLLVHRSEVGSNSSEVMECGAMVALHRGVKGKDVPSSKNPPTAIGQ